MSRKKLFISLMIGMGSPFMALLMGMIDQRILAGIGLLYIVVLNVLSSIKVMKDNYVNLSGFLIAMNLVIPLFSFLCGNSLQSNPDYLLLTLKVLVMIVFTIINCIGLFAPISDYYENEIRWRFTEQKGL